MDAGDLHKLAKAMRQIATAATSDAGESMSAAEALVGMDLFTHSATTVGEVARRTGVAQSQVSKIAAELVQQQILMTARDPNDRRRTLLSVRAEALRDIGSQRGARDPRSALTHWLADHGRPHGSDDVDRILAALGALTTLID